MNLINSHFIGLVLPTEESPEIFQTYDFRAYHTRIDAWVRIRAYQTELGNEIYVSDQHELLFLNKGIRNNLGKKEEIISVIPVEDIAQTTRGNLYQKKFDINYTDKEIPWWIKLMKGIMQWKLNKDFNSGK